MKIAGIQKLTLLDYPGNTAATIFTFGCNFRCPFCHNADLVSHSEKSVSTAPSLTEEEFFAFLEKRQSLLDGICITGGEPTLQHDLLEFCSRIKKLGFLVKVDTNGSHPKILQHLIEKHLIDYVAMDIKNSPDRYQETVGLADYKTHQQTNNHFSIESIEESMRLLLAGTTPFEFRTTVLFELHTKESLINTAQWIANLAKQETFPTEKVAWFIQQFVDSDTILMGKGLYSPWNEDKLRALLPSLQSIIPQTALRGL